MNLHGIVKNAVSAVNPRVTVAIQASNGYTTGPSGRRVPSYDAPVYRRAQIQALQYNDIAQTDGLNIQGEKRAVYISGSWNGLVRDDKKGGDIITFPDGTVWLVTLVLERWPDWCKLAITRQDGS